MSSSQQSLEGSKAADAPEELDILPEEMVANGTGKAERGKGSDHGRAVAISARDKHRQKQGVQIVVGSSNFDPQNDTPTLHGNSAAMRRAITELLFFASVGDLVRCKRIASVWSLNVSDPTCSDYDKRAPLHLAAREGAWAVTEWLLESGASINAVDRFQRTPLEEAVRANRAEIVQLLVKAGGRIFEGNKLVPLEQSQLAQHGKRMMFVEPDYDTWEIDPNDLVMHEVLGEGEFGIVRRASFHGTDVAVKLLKVSHGIALGDFRTEIAILRQVHHPNAVQFLGACTKETPYMMVTELMHGGSLSDSFQLLNFSLPLRRSLELALDAARGMNYLHVNRSTPIIHRDLKPGNFMITGSPYSGRRKLVQEIGVLKIADFGLSKTMPQAHADSSDDAYKMTGETGTYRYMAPEVFRHEQYSSKVDVYAFAMVCFELFEGRYAFDGCDGISAAKSAAFQNHRPIMLRLDKPKDPVRYAMKQLIEQMWAPDPDDRPTFAAIVQQLQQLLKNAQKSQAATAAGQGCCALQ